MLQDGKVTFAYKKASKTMSTGSNGRFAFEIDNVTILQDEDSTKNTLQSISFPLKKGSHDLAWSYSFRVSKNFSNPLAEIAVIFLY